ncbi:MAG: inverse autotransporter beta domain-containing protein [Chlamydiia bacterium]|nr:inverse autotransporter beta domain-containing protein [Chlamydiia bacterium]
MKKDLLIFALFLSSGLSAGSLREFSTESSITLKTRQYNGVGYDNGYSTGAAFLAPVWRHEFLPFIDLRAHVFDDGRFAFNGGLGLRIPVNEWIFGGNVFYDYRNADKFSPQQIGGGLEALGKHLDIRLNGYGPIVDTDYFTRKPVVMQGHSASYTEVAQAALPVIAGEIGVPFNDRCSNAAWYGALGPYYLFGRKVHDFNLGGSWGGQARLAATFGKIFQIECDVTYDKIFHTTVQGVMALRFPLGPRNLSYKNAKKDVLCNPMTQPVIRNEIIPIQDPERTLPFINTMTEQPAHFVIVNPSMSGSEGTWESPYSTLRDAENSSKAGDIILVAHGEYHEGITLKENQLFISTAMPVFSGEIYAGPWHFDQPLLRGGVVLDNGSRVIGFHLNTKDESAFSIQGKSAAIINCNIQTTAKCSIDAIDAPRLDIAYCRFAPDTEICFQSKVDSVLQLFENTFEGSNHERVYIDALDQAQVRVEAIKNNFMLSTFSAGIKENASAVMIFQDNKWDYADLYITADGSCALVLNNNEIGELVADVDSLKQTQFIMQSNHLQRPVSLKFGGKGTFQSSVTENKGAKINMDVTGTFEGVFQAENNPNSSLLLNAADTTNLSLKFSEDAWPAGDSTATKH